MMSNTLYLWGTTRDFELNSNVHGEGYLDDKILRNHTVQFGAPYSALGHSAKFFFAFVNKDRYFDEMQISFLDSNNPKSLTLLL